MNWKIEGKTLTKEFEFSSFRQAVGFIDKILPLADAANHHPDVSIHSYKKVKIILTTHSEGAVTEQDYALAKQIDSILQHPTPETLKEWHDNSANWKWGVLYYNPEDPRIFPPKRISAFGWTVNFANPRSYLTLVGIVAVIAITTHLLQ